tara:strand:+ start:2534 stop:2782 length:249 start_codon:yes stop_codon:yes gene_type:complete
MLIFTKHALEKMDALGIEKEEIKRVIQSGMKWKDHKDKWHAQLGGTEVVFDKQKNTIIITTTLLGEKNEMCNVQRKNSKKSS